MSISLKQVKIAYKFVDGVHFFVAGDKMAAGLCVAHSDLSVAYDEVGKQLTFLFEVNYGKKTKFTPSIPLSMFQKTIRAYDAINALNETADIENSTIQPWVINSSRARQKEIA